jgi:CheY-like chemotaxis protein
MKFSSQNESRFRKCLIIRHQPINLPYLGANRPLQNGPVAGYFSIHFRTPWIDPIPPQKYIRCLGRPQISAMNPQCLIFSSDEKTIRVLRRVLGGFQIGAEVCRDVDSAIRELTRRRFEGVILDVENERSATRLLASIQSAPSNQHAILVAVSERARNRQAGLLKEADFVLYKPVTFEQAHRSFQAARYLMKCECRRNTRVAVQCPVSFLGANGKAEQRAVTSDISEEGMAVRFSRLYKKINPIRLRFTLPGTDHVVECTAELSWQNAQSDAGFRFVDLTREDREQLRAWLSPYYFDYQIPAEIMPEVLPGFLPATE